MARRRDYRAEAARRNELAREQGYSSYYQQRLARAREQHKGISTGAARGHASREERKVADLIRLLKSQPTDAQVSFVSKDRKPDGTYGTGWFDVTYIDARGKARVDVFEIDAKVLQSRLDEIAEVIAIYIGQGFLGWGSP